MNFEEKVKAMTGKEIVLAMVDSLTPPPLIKIDMETYGRIGISEPVKFLGIIIKKEKEICFGCAATNTICKIAGKPFTIDNIKGVDSRADFLNTSYNFLRNFEFAIDSLRKGQIDNYNLLAGNINIAKLNPIHDLPKLENNYTMEDLNYYRTFANNQ